MNSQLAINSFQSNDQERYFELVLKCTEFTSVNSLHGINTHTKVVFDLPHVTRFRNEFKEQLILADPRKKCKWFDPRLNFFFAAKFILNHGYFHRDLDNCVKVTQDEIARAIGINDSHIIETHFYKALREGPWEYLILKFGVSNYNYQEFNNF